MGCRDFKKGEGSGKARDEREFLGSHVCSCLSFHALYESSCEEEKRKRWVFIVCLSFLSMTRHQAEGEGEKGGR